MRSRSMSGFDAPYRPGWDCHGLPIELKVDRDLGAKKREMSPIEFRAGLPRVRREVRRHPARRSSSAWACSASGTTPTSRWRPPTRRRSCGSSPRFVEQGLVYKAKKSVHWCISCRTALAEAEVEYDEHHVSPSIDVRFPLAEAERDRLAAQHPGLAGKRVSAVIWTTTPWTLPANLALAFHPDAEYGFYPVEGTNEVLVLARGAARRIRGALAREGQPAGAPPRLGEPLADGRTARELEGLRFRHPWIDRDSPALLADYVTLDTGTGIVHTAPGHGWDDYLTGVRYGLDIYCPVDEGGRFLPEVEHFAGQRVFDANPEVVELLRERGACSRPARTRTPTRSAGAARTRSSSAPPSSGSSRSTRASPLREQALRAIAAVALAPGLGRGAHPQHDRDPPRLVHLAPAPVGRADPGLLLQGLRRGPAARRSSSRHVADGLRAGDAPTPGTPARRSSCCRPASPAPSAAARSSTKETRHPRRLVRLRLVARRRARPAARPALARRRLPRGQRPAPRLVPLVAADRRRDARPRALPTR